MSSILSTSVCGDGTQTTSLPGWPTRGSNGAVVVCCAEAAEAISSNATASTQLFAARNAVIIVTPRLGIVYATTSSRTMTFTIAGDVEQRSTSTVRGAFAGDDRHRHRAAPARSRRELDATR